MTMRTVPGLIPGAHVHQFECGSRELVVVDYYHRAHPAVTVILPELWYQDWAERGLSVVEPSVLRQVADRLHVFHGRTIVCIDERLEDLGKGVKRFLAWRITRLDFMDHRPEEVDSIREAVITTTEEVLGTRLNIRDSLFLFQAP